MACHLGNPCHPAQHAPANAICAHSDTVVARSGGGRCAHRLLDGGEGRWTQDLAEQLREAAVAKAAAAAQKAAVQEGAAHEGAAPGADGPRERVGAWRGANFVFDKRTPVVPRPTTQGEGDEEDDAHGGAGTP